MRKNNTFVHIHDNTFACKRQRYIGAYQYCFDLKDPKKSERRG